MKKYIFAVIVVALAGCSASNVPNIKQNARETLKKMGFTVIGYEGYQWTGYGRWGGCVWYLMERNGVTYDGCLSKWGDEYHLYSLTALDAVKGGGAK